MVESQRFFSIDCVKPTFLESDPVQPPKVTETVRSDKPSIPVTRETKTRYGRTTFYREVCYESAFGDGPRHSEPRSSDEDDT
ncbi:hypothetical protein TNCV_4165701 [Trichonephila clavipes]|nr:hypothetical protein TNCV_4165701 [Trichonephila clavipes]